MVNQKKMTNQQSKRYELFARFYELQKAIDNAKTEETKQILEQQKKVIIMQLEG